jgi:L-iditol 2-dehydrogenase
VEKGGTVLFFAGAPEGATLPALINDLFWRTEITLTSTYAGAPADCMTALKLIREKVVPVLKTVTHRLPMADGPIGFQMVSTPTEYDCIKVIVQPQL